MLLLSSSVAPCFLHIGVTPLTYSDLSHLGPLHLSVDSLPGSCFLRDNHLLLLGDDSRVSPRANILGGSRVGDDGTCEWYRKVTGS